MTHAARFEDQLFTEFQFNARHLSPLRRLYRQLGRDSLGDDFSFRESPGLHANMTWQYASNPHTLDAFRHCLTGSRLRESLSIVLGSPQLLAACFVVVKGDIPAMDFHMDYGEREIPAGVTGTMLTPLFTFDKAFGHLDYRVALEEFRYTYRLGDAILFDGKFEHRSEASRSSTTATRVLVSWSIATDDVRYRHAISRIIDSQTK